VCCWLHYNYFYSSLSFLLSCPHVNVVALIIIIDVRVRNEITNANETKELTPSEMEDLIHLQGPLTGE
jgi:hypothetical protein